MLAFALFFSRIKKKQQAPRPDVLAEEYEWVFGRKQAAAPRGTEKPATGKRSDRSGYGATTLLTPKGSKS